MERETNRTLVERLNRDAQHIAWRFGLRYRTIEAERANVTRRFGVCYDDGVIKIRLRHAVTGQPLRYSSLISTLCHELAHLRYFNHGLRFRAFNQQLLEFARAEKIYRPGEPAPTPERTTRGVQTRNAGRATRLGRPVQLSLF
jgi:predicted metal-dependent hydrolase